MSPEEFLNGEHTLSELLDYVDAEAVRRRSHEESVRRSGAA